VPTLEDYLAIIVEVQHPDILKKVRGIFDSSGWDDVDARVREQIARLGTIYSGNLYDGEVVYHAPGNGAIELIDFNVISVSNEGIEVVAKVKVPVSFDVQYLDTTSASYDSEDQAYIGGEIETVTFEEDVTISVLVIIDPVGDDVTDVDILTRDLHLKEPYEDFK
jgi:hypothetical protein